jgi:Protein of unknown function (Porph_ging).
MFSFCVNAQTTLDTSYVECKYSFTFMKDTLENVKTVQDPSMILQVGRNYTKFYSYSEFVSDSVMHSLSLAEQEKLLAGGMFDFMQKYPRGESYKIYKNLSENKITFTDKKIMEKMRYYEPIPKQDWEILDETKQISGYECQKATCSFRGRDYVAWFTSEIPVNEGPWKFSGLPGLIVKVHDTKEHYDFELYSVQKIKKDIVFGEEYPEISRADYVRITRSLIKNPFAGQDVTITNLDGTPFKPNVKVRHYDLMERDIK